MSALRRKGLFVAGKVARIQVVLNDVDGGAISR